MKMTSGYLAGQLLIAMPQLSDPNFARAVVYVCAHTADGAMGLVINRALDGVSFPELLDQLGIPAGPGAEQIRIYFGGPVEAGRGFVLHSTDYVHESTLMVDKGVALTATVDVLRAISSGTGPHAALLALGYAGWNAGQLDAEILDNSWLTLAAEPDLLFGGDPDGKWERAGASGCV